MEVIFLFSKQYLSFCGTHIYLPMAIDPLSKQKSLHRQIRFPSAF
jgi:hypothetical protein